MRTSYHKRLVVLIESSFVIVKRHKLSHIGVHYFWLRKILPIAYSILRFKPLITSFLTSFYLFAIHVVLLTCLFQSFNAK